MYIGGGMSFGAWILAAISIAFGLAVTIGIVVLIALGIRWLLRQDQGSRYMAPAPGGSDALEILRQRYARGEIDDAEYQRRRQVLLGPGPGPGPSA
jgi:putative membrane protein